MRGPGARERGGDGQRWWRDEAWLAIGGPALIFVGHALYGAMLPQTALSFTFVWAILAGLCLVRGRLRGDLLRLDGLAIPAALFAVVLIVAIWSLTPLVPGGPHPVWAYLGISPGAATVDRSVVALEATKMLGLACAFVVGLASGGTDNRARRTLNAVLAIGALYAGWAFLSFVVSRAPLSNRLEASFLSANAAGTLFAALFVLALGPMASRLRAAGPGRLVGATPIALAALAFLICLFMTASRGAFAGAGAGLIAFGLLQAFGGRVRLSRVALLGAGGGLLVVILLILAGAPLLGRILGTHGDIDSRGVIATTHWEAFLTSPIMGFGLGSFDTVNRMLVDSANFPHLWKVRAAHNVYLGWLEQAGLLGALPMFACVGLLIATTVRRAMRRSRALDLIFALIATNAVILVHGVTDFALEMFALAAMWAYLLGLQLSLAQGSSTR